MNIKIGNTSKRINSTSQSFTGTTLSCVLKEPCSMQSPIFQVQGLTKGNLYNYASFEGRYYWVDDITYLTNNIQEVHCHLDPLATYKSAILDTYAYVAYGSSLFWNKKVDDTRFGPDYKYIEAGSRQGLFNIGMTTAHWSVALTVNAAYDQATNGVITYFMSWSTFKNVLSTFSGEVTADFNRFTVADIFDMIQNFFIKTCLGGGVALDNVKSCTLVPVAVETVFDPLDPGTQGSLTNIIQIGPYQVTGFTGNVYIINPYVMLAIGEQSINLMRPSGVNDTMTWLNSPKYCSVKITHPCGYVDINDPAIRDVNTIYAYTVLSPVTGDYVCRFTAEQGKTTDTIAMVGGNVGIDIMSLINNTGSTVGGQMLKLEAQVGGSVVGGILSQIKSPAASKNVSAKPVGNSMQAQLRAAGEKAYADMNTTTQSSGCSSGIEGNFNAGTMAPAHGGASTSGGMAGMYAMGTNGWGSYDIEYYYPSIFGVGVSGIVSSYYIAYCDEYGYPIKNYMKIGDMTGYVECVGASVKGATGASEASKSTINSYLNSGLYIE